MVGITLDFNDENWEKRALSCLTAGAWLMRVPDERLGELALLAVENGIALNHAPKRDGIWVSAKSTADERVQPSLDRTVPPPGRS